MSNKMICNQLNKFERAVLLDALREHKIENQKMTTSNNEQVSAISKIVVHLCDKLMMEIKSIEQS